MRRNLHVYLRKHKDCEVYKGQDLKPGQKPRKALKKRVRSDAVGGGGAFGGSLKRLSEAGVELTGLKVAYVAESVCGQCRVLYAHEEYCEMCHLLTRRQRTVCRNYACRMKRVGVEGSLHPSLRGVGGGVQEDCWRVADGGQRSFGGDVGAEQLPSIDPAFDSWKCVDSAYTF